MSIGIYDGAQVKRAFSRSAHSYPEASGLQREIESRLLESLEYLDDPALRRPPPAWAVDVGAGPGTAAAAMAKRWPRARVVALDIALPMLRQARGGARRWPLRRHRFDRVCADARALPFVEHSIDVVVSNLCLQWVDDLATTLAGFRRVLKPGGLLLLSTFGPTTLSELRAAFAAIDDHPHVSPFASIAQLGDALMHAGFRDPVLDRDIFVQRYRDLPALMRQLRAMGATNALRRRRQTLTGPRRFAAAAAAYASWRGDDGLLPASWEAIYAQAWAPEYGVPIRTANQGDVVGIPATAVPIRRRR